MKTVLILTGIIIVMLFILAALLKCLGKERSRRKELEKTVEQQEQNLVYLFKHSREISAIESEKNKISQEIKEGKSDEEIVSIINSVIAANNSRVSKSAKTEDSSSSAAR